MTHKKALLMLAAGALAIAWLGARTDVDLRLAHAMYDPVKGAFPMRHAWLAETFSHAYLKNVMLLLAACALLPAAVDCWRPRSWPNRFRLRPRVVALASLLVPLATTLLKRASSSHCSWDRYLGIRVCTGVDAAVARRELPHAYAMVDVDRLRHRLCAARVDASFPETQPGRRATRTDRQLDGLSRFR